MNKWAQNALTRRLERIEAAAFADLDEQQAIRGFLEAVAAKGEAVTVNGVVVAQGVPTAEDWKRATEEVKSPKAAIRE